MKTERQLHQILHSLQGCRRTETVPAAAIRVVRYCALYTVFCMCSSGAAAFVKSESIQQAVCPLPKIAGHPRPAKRICISISTSTSYLAIFQDPTPTLWAILSTTTNTYIQPWTPLLRASRSHLNAAQLRALNDELPM